MCQAASFTINVRYVTKTLTISSNLIYGRKNMTFYRNDLRFMLHP